MSDVVEDGSQAAVSAIYSQPEATAINTTLAAYALNLMYGAELADFERDHLIQMAALAGAKVGPSHIALEEQRRQRQEKAEGMQLERAVLRDALRSCRDQFRRYEQLHALKPDGSGREKAKVNAEFADMCDRVLGEQSGDRPQ